jgi:hypothetical protein
MVGCCERYCTSHFSWMSLGSRTSTLRRLHTVLKYSYCKKKGKAHSVCFPLLLHILWQFSFSTHQMLPKDDLSTSPIRAVILQHSWLQGRHVCLCQRCKLLSSISLDVATPRHPRLDLHQAWTDFLRGDVFLQYLDSLQY